MRALLIWPPLPRVYARLGVADRTVAPPLGIASLAAVLEGGGVEVDVLDMAGLGATEEDLRARLSATQPELVGVSCLMANLEGGALAACRVAKEVVPDSWVVLGGNHATFSAARILEAEPAVDAVVLYEGEESLLEVAGARRDSRSLATVPGLAIRSDGAVRETPPRPRLTDLDRYPLPARHLLPMSRYDERYRGNLITSRGCPFRCAYCSTAAFNGRKLRARSVAKVMEEIRDLVERHGIAHLNFVDDTFTVDRRRTMELCRRIAQEHPAVTWGCETRVDLVDEPLLEAMRLGGCRTIFYGIESAYQPALDRVEKGFTLEAARRALRATTAAGIDAQVSFMIGLPEEGEECADRVLELVRDTKPSMVMCGMLAVYPGTELHARPAAYGIRAIATQRMNGSQQLTPMVVTDWMDEDAQRRCYVRIAAALSEQSRREDLR